MNIKSKIPCTAHYGEYLDKKSKDYKTSMEEFRSIYDPKCPDCRECYKCPGNNSLFYPHFWKYSYKFNCWIFSKKSYNSKVLFLKTVYRNFGFWKTLRAVFYYRSHYDQYKCLSVPFLDIHWFPYEFDDIRRC